jgi:peptide/nickel transport system permease protein
MATEIDSPADHRADPIDWDEIDEGRIAVSRRTQVFVAALCVLAGLFLYDAFTGYDLWIGAWYTSSRIDWLYLVSLVVFVLYVVVPLAHNRERTAQYWRRFRTNRLAVLCLLYLVVFFALGTASLLVLGRPELHVQYSYQPPLFSTIEEGTIAQTCAGQVTGPAIEEYCHGSLRFPLGTNQSGQSLLGLAIAGMGVALVVALVTSMIMVPIATIVGVTAGYSGGWVDEVLMRYVDIQQTVPAFLIYILLSLVYGASLFLIVLTFGLLSWGGVARLVRSEVVKRREELYITAAESAGASRLQVVRRHVLPNVSNTIVTATTRQIPFLILAEAAIAFIGKIGDENVPSWGEAIALGFDVSQFPKTWWLVAVPAAFLVVTVFSFSVVGDALRDTLDPRGEA